MIVHTDRDLSQELLYSLQLHSINLICKNINTDMNTDLFPGC